MQIYQVDAFATEVFRGNPAAVCLRFDGATATRTGCSRWPPR